MTAVRLSHSPPSTVHRPPSTVHHPPYLLVATNIFILNRMYVRQIQDRSKTQEVNHVASSSERDYSNHAHG